MIKVTFFTSDNGITGFESRGHSDYADEGSDIVCAAVSSAVYMTVNTLTDIVRCQAKVNVSNGKMSFHVTTKLSEAQQILEGFKLHIEALAADYPNNIKVTLRRCQNA